MLQRIVSYFWLVLLAMVLPTQAFAYLLQAENEASARLSYRSLGASPSSEQDFQALFDEVRQEPQSEPVTQSDIAQDWLAIINANRWSNVTRVLDDAEPKSNLETVGFEPAAIPLYRLYKLPVVTSTQRVSNQNAIYRVSGWKESNTLYVALNGHF
ncbi:hypothetical protein VIOR3934_00295 [Vibrio orientalis CIP 102891 = ATCC 33934]|uniref:Uncharacterized protein n=1 Tax=Vibrio orientalis CIP 102891 = ATCC 33934 TaxID=675816 RepID=C9QGS1_VIBOR|nr:hypothetical protein [Vibrio orientalis]EEX93782.1 hypothetical protein VIA_000939 [Vibrio orientalis CIP 102891 = ATCC 33934]EGU50790.1 hypothetical protein VIOR3934_00295 [Vibrio orientalis CIP 102891 = ATCC 33934]